MRIIDSFENYTESNGNIINRHGKTIKPDKNGVVKLCEGGKYTSRSAKKLLFDVDYDKYFPVNFDGFGHKYLISKCGEVLSLKGNTTLKHMINYKGYGWVRFYRDNGEKRQITVHRLVALTFIENPLNKPQVNHKDGDKRNNRVENLEWVTNQENMDHAVANNLIGRSNSNKNGNMQGEKVNTAKMTEAMVIEMRKYHLENFGTGKAAHGSKPWEKYGISKGNYRVIINRKTWRHVNG